MPDKVTCIHRTTTAVLITAVLGLGGQSWAQTIKFKEVAKELGVPGNTVDGVSAYGHGVIMADINNDGLPDIYISNAVRYANRLSETLYLTSPNGYFENDKARGVDDPYGWTGSHGICFVDYDNDGDYDIFNATTDDRNRLYQNDGKAYFKDVTDAAKLPLIRKVFPDFDSKPYGYGTRGVLAFDANNDGYMDLLAVNWGPAETRYDENDKIVTPPQPNEFYLNNGNGTFKTVDNSGLTQPPNSSWMGTQGVVAGDIDGDGDIDVFIVHRNYTGVSEGGQVLAGFDPGRQIPNQLMINNGSGNFTDETAKRGLFDAMNDANGATFADYDNDGDLDIFVAPKDKNLKYVRSYRNRGNGYFDEMTDQLKITQWGFSTFFLDADNDGDLDIIAPRTRESTIFYRNRGDGTLEQVNNTGIEIYNYDPRGGAVADIDDDGDLDIYFADANKEISSDSGNRLYRNELQSANRWLKITGRGVKGDMGGFGTKIWLFERGQMDNMSRLLGYRDVQNAYGYLCQDDPVQHFGLGLRDTVDVKVRMPDGTILKMLAAPAKSKLFFSKPSQMAKIGGDNQSGQMFTVLPQPLQVRVRDAFGNNVYGARVIFSADDPAAQFSSAEVYSDRNGIAKVLYTAGGNASQTVTAYCEAAPTSKVTFTITATQPTVNQLAKISGDHQKGQAAYPLPQKLIVRALDRQGAGVSGQLIIFQPAEGSGQVNSSAHAEIQTDAGGYAEAQWTLGGQPSTTQSVDVIVKNQPTLLQRFTATAFGPATQLLWASSLHFTGQVNAELPDSLIARVTDDDGNPLRAVMVKFEVIEGGGQVNGQSSLSQQTDADGKAQVIWRLGTQAGTDNQKLRVSSTGLRGSPVVVTATAQAAPADRLAKIAGDEQIGYLTQPLPEPLTVQVTDEFDNPVAGHKVTFAITQGDGTFSGKTQQTVKTLSDGTASVIFTLGKVAEYTVRAVSQNGGVALNGSPAVFKLHGVAGEPSAEQSEFTAPIKLIADGETRGELLITLRDAFGNPVADQAVQIQATGVAVNLTQPQQTDAFGRTSTFFTTTMIGQVIFQLTLNDQPLLARSVACIAGPPAQMMVFGDRQMQRAGEILTQPIAVLVTDALSHPVAGQPVTFGVIDGSGSILERQPVLANTAGFAEAHWRLGERIGSQHAQASIEGLDAVRFTAEALPQGAVRLFIVSGNMQIIAPAALADSFVVQLADSLSHPIPNAAITFSVQGGAGTTNGTFVTPVERLTDANGRASALFRAGTESGLKLITAASKWGSVQFTVLVQQGALLTFEKLSPDGVAAAPHAEIEVAVRVRDGLGRPAAGEPLLCTATGGGAAVDQPPYFTSAEGLFTAKWRLGAAGLQTLEIKALNGRGSAVYSALVANHAPAFVMPSPIPRSINLLAGDRALLVFKARDSENETVTYRTQGLPAGAGWRTGAETVLDWTPGTDQTGDFAVTIFAADPHGAVDSLHVTLQVSRNYLYFPLRRRLPESPAEVPYDRPAVFVVEPADSTTGIIWQTDTVQHATGPILSMTFMEKQFPKPDVYIAAHISAGERLQIVSWRVRLVSGRSVDTAEGQTPMPAKTALAQNFPNPFNPTTTIRYALASATTVRLAVYSLNGRLIKTLMEGAVPAGEHQSEWDGRDEQGEIVPSGVYYCRLQAGEAVETRKLTLLK